MKQPTDNAIVFFDGECAGCSAFVRFLLQKDKKQYFQFASLQTEFSKTLLGETDLSTLILLERGERLEKSTAVIRIFSKLGFPWFFMGLLMVVPALLRDRCYDFVARRRHSISRRFNYCKLLSSSESSRVIA